MTALSHIHWLKFTDVCSKSCVIAQTLEVKIILKESKMKSRVILIFFFREIFVGVSAAELINSIEHNYEQQANKTSGKKSYLLGSKPKQIRCRMRVYTSSCFLHINLKRSYDIIAYNKML